MDTSSWYRDVTHQPSTCTVPRRLRPVDTADDVYRNAETGNAARGRLEIADWRPSSEDSVTSATEFSVVTDYCSACMSPIRDRHFLSAVGRSWHSACLVCADCRLPFDRQLTCYNGPDGRIYCRDDYLRLVFLYCRSSNMEQWFFIA